MTESDAEFMGIFRDEANERLDAIVGALLALERGGDASDAIDGLFRDFHTIKGTAGMLGLDDVRVLAHAVEDVLGEVRTAGTFPRELADPLLRAADALRLQVNGNGVAPEGLVEELRAVTGGGGDNRADAKLQPVTEPGRPRETNRRAIRVPADKIDKLLDLVGETVLHRRRLEHALDAVRPDENGLLADELDLVERLLLELQEAALGMRTLPLASITGSLARAVRDLAAVGGKEVDLEITGADTELDRVILEGLSEPLVHILRNAIAHGVEDPSERMRAGKPERGRLQLSAEQRGRLIAVTIADDGRGVSREAVAEAAREGVPLVSVLTRAGFSTAAELSELSGRGVGLDAVKAHVEAVGGRLELESEPGQGTRTTLLLPLTLALLDVLLVERGPHLFGLPLSAVDEAVSVDATLSLAGKPALELRGRAIQLADLADLAGAEAPPAPKHAPALVVVSSGKRIAIVCDRLLGEQDVVVKPLSPLLGHLPGYLGAAILGDGRIALLLDPSSLAKAEHISRTQRDEEQSRKSSAPRILVVEDSFTVRELQRGILEAGGYQVATARNGREALEMLDSGGGFALVVTDLEMPELDGLALTKAIRAHPERSALPVVVVTTLASEEDRQRGLEAGADAYMAKRGYDQRALLEIVGGLVGR